MGCEEPKLISGSQPITRKEDHLPDHLLQEIDRLILTLIRGPALKGVDLKRWFKLRFSKNLKQCFENGTPVFSLETDKLVPIEELAQIFNVAVSEELLRIPWHNLENSVKERIWCLLDEYKIKIGSHWELLPGECFPK